MSRKLFGIILVPVLVSSFSPDSRAFWSVGKSVHQSITSEALSQPLFSLVQDRQTYPFSNLAIASINRAHFEADTDTYRAADHFDSEALAASYQLLTTRYQQLVAYLSNGNKVGNRRQIWRLYGLMLHQVQDFYSHSTWVASGRTEIADFGKSISQGKMPPFLLPPDGIGMVCEAGGVRILNTAALTTGYYQVALPPGKCEHGTLYNAGMGCFFPSSMPNGINLDTDCRDPAGHARARELAIQETIALTQALLKDAYKRVPDVVGFDRPFCAFVDDSPRRYSEKCS
jgi:von Willebrand factor A domain-containing protein 7